MIRRVLVAMTLAVVLAGVAPGAASAQDNPVQDSTGQDEIPAQCRTIVGCADAGPKPEHPGDRGGYAQILTLVVLAGGVGFIMTKIARAAKGSQPDAAG